MSITVQVANQPPETDTNVPQPMLELFQQFVGQGVVPFQHQSETFRHVDQDQEILLVAGTAAGKTLAVAVPLFHKLATGRIRKVLLMYPTIALMEDQGKVMRRLAELTGQETAQIQGGMSRSQLLAALNKPVILATPDAIYWFFHKNVKYSGLLVYALALIDEFVLDEAHLFNGLMLRNFEHLWRRIQSLAAILGKVPRLHVLTATPTGALQRLNNGIQIAGRSKCRDVTVEFRACGRFDRGKAMAAAIEDALDAGRRKVLVVCNSARVAHQLFEQFKVGGEAALPVTHRLRFGRIRLGKLLEFLEERGVEVEILDRMSARLFRQEDLTLQDLPAGAQVTLPLTAVVSAVTEVLERQTWLVKRALWARTQQPGETWESLLHNRPLPCQIVAALRRQLEAAPDLERQKTLVDNWLTDTLDKVGSVAEEEVPCQAPGFDGLQQCLVPTLGDNLAKEVMKRLRHGFEVDPEWTDIPPRDLSHRPIYLRWLDWLVDPEQVDHIRSLVQAGLESGVLQVDCRHIGLWKGTDVPMVVYSGSMAKHARAGLIEVFSDLDRAVLISTSAVEVGVDFAADTLITEECEANGFLQRFGRVGRHGDDSRVLVLVSGDVATQWSTLDGQCLSREEFSERILATFPQRNYAAASALADAGHYLVNEQLGRIGTRLNQSSALVAASSLAGQLRAAEVPVAFGLRSTLPQIVLRDGVSKDPFYLLRYVDNQDLRPSDSPFEVAQANIWFTELIFQKARFSVMVDLNATLRASRVWFGMINGELQINKAQPGIGLDYAVRMNAYYQQHGGWDPWLPGNFVLLHGDVYLQRTEAGIDYSPPEPVCDNEQNPLFLPGQNYLVFLGWQDVSEAQERIGPSPIADWEELYYDWDGTTVNHALVLLEQNAGACFAAYKEWMGYVGRRLQK